VLPGPRNRISARPGSQLRSRPATDPATNPPRAQRPDDHGAVLYTGTQTLLFGPRIRAVPAVALSATDRDAVLIPRDRGIPAPRAPAAAQQLGTPMTITKRGMIGWVRQAPDA
jgi:hypothetical protein